MHHAPALELCDLYIGDPHGVVELACRKPDKARELSPGRYRGPPPQLRDARVEQHGRLEVIAVTAQRLTDDRVVLAVVLSTAACSAVLTAPRWAEVARLIEMGSAMDRSKARRGQGREDLRVLCHALVHILGSTGEAS